MITWTSKGIELEADPRRLILQEVGCEGANVTTPPVKERMEDVYESEPFKFSSEEAARYRSVSMRLAYLPQDRPDLLLLGKELA